MKRPFLTDPKTGRITGITKYTNEIVPFLDKYITETDYPLVEELCLKLDIDSSTVGEWDKFYPEFRHLHERLLLKQKTWLLKGTLNNDINIIGGIFQLKANHGLKDHPDETHDTNIVVHTTNYSSKKEVRTEAKRLKKLGILGKSIADKKRISNVTELKDDVDNLIDEAR